MRLVRGIEPDDLRERIQSIGVHDAALYADGLLFGEVVIDLSVKAVCCARPGIPVAPLLVLVMPGGQAIADTIIAIGIQGRASNGAELTAAELERGSLHFFRRFRDDIAAAGEARRVRRLDGIKTAEGKPGRGKLRKKNSG
jgi:hypothetical protein